MVLRRSCFNLRRFAPHHVNSWVTTPPWVCSMQGDLLACVCMEEHSKRGKVLACTAAGFLAGLALVVAEPRKPVGCDSKAQFYPKDIAHLLQPTEENPTPVAVPPPFPGLAHQSWARPHVAAIFGLPMRGKSFMARELKRYIEYFEGARAAIFDITHYLGPNGEDELLRDLKCFLGEVADPYAFGQEQKELSTGGFAIILASDAVESQESKWSAHNKKHRKWIARTLQRETDALLCFIQISVNGPKGEKYIEDLAAHRGKSLKEARALIEDYLDYYVPIQMDDSENNTAFIQLKNYNETMIVHQMMRHLVGSRVCHFLSNVHPYQHTIYLSRHGESLFNVEQKLGGDSGLSRRGEEYARRLAEFSKYVVCGKATNLVCVSLMPVDIQKLPLMLSDTAGCGHALVAHVDWTGFGDASGGLVQAGMQLKRLQVGYGSAFMDAPSKVEQLISTIQTSGGDAVVTLVFVAGDTSEAGQVPGVLWTSSLRRTIETGQFIEHPTLLGPDGRPFEQMHGSQYRSLDEVYAGECDGLTEEDIKERYPDVAADRKRDKLGFRYPRGESYYDIIARIQNAMAHLERMEEPVLLISHQAVLRMIYGWLAQKTREAAIKTEVPQHEVIKMSYNGLGGPVIETRYPLGPTRLVDDGQRDF